MATCSCNSRPFVMNHAIASAASLASMLCSGDTIDTLKRIKLPCYSDKLRKVLTFKPHSIQSRQAPTYIVVSSSVPVSSPSKEIPSTTPTFERHSHDRSSYMPLLPVPDIISPTRQSSIQRPIYTLKLFGPGPSLWPASENPDITAWGGFIPSFPTTSS